MEPGTRCEVLLRHGGALSVFNCSPELGNCLGVKLIIIVGKYVVGVLRPKPAHNDTNRRPPIYCFINAPLWLHNAPRNLDNYLVTSIIPGDAFERISDHVFVPQMVRWILWVCMCVFKHKGDEICDKFTRQRKWNGRVHKRFIMCVFVIYELVR